MYKINEVSDIWYSTGNREYSQYFIITLNGIQLMKY